MKLNKFLSVVGLVTFFCLLYVYQQTEIFRLGYIAQEKLSLFDDSLDKNTILRYNINKKVSLVHIGVKVSGSADYEMPTSFQLVSISPLKGAQQVSQQQANRETVLSRIFGVKRAAEAETINH